MGCIHIYCGNGKGKTTAAIGLAVRAAGRNHRVLIARFLKTDDSGEVVSLKHIPGITVLPCRETFGFYWNMTEEEKLRAACYYADLLEKAFLTAEQTDARLLVLDEVIAACNHRLVEEGRLKQLLLNRGSELEVVMTGRNPSEALMDGTDYISEIKAIKHPYEKGIPARIGIEF